MSGYSLRKIFESNLTFYLPLVHQGLWWDLWPIGLKDYLKGKRGLSQSHCDEPGWSKIGKLIWKYVFFQVAYTTCVLFTVVMQTKQSAVSLAVEELDLEELV